MNKLPDPLAEALTPRQHYQEELQAAIKFYVSEIATLRRIKEITQDQDVKDEITGIIQYELTIIESYRRELN